MLTIHFLLNIVVFILQVLTDILDNGRVVSAQYSGALAHVGVIDSASLPVALSLFVVSVDQVLVVIITAEPPFLGLDQFSVFQPMLAGDVANINSFIGRINLSLYIIDILKDHALLFILIFQESDHPPSPSASRRRVLRFESLIYALLIDLVQIKLGQSIILSTVRQLFVAIARFFFSFCVTDGLFWLNIHSVIADDFLLEQAALVMKKHVFVCLVYHFAMVLLVLLVLVLLHLVLLVLLVLVGIGVAMAVLQIL